MKQIEAKKRSKKQQILYIYFDRTTTTTALPIIAGQNSLIFLKIIAKIFMEMGTCFSFNFRDVIDNRPIR